MHKVISARYDKQRKIYVREALRGVFAQLNKLYAGVLLSIEEYSNSSYTKCTEKIINQPRNENRPDKISSSSIIRLWQPISTLQCKIS
jgi:hypothetical protein